MKSTIKDLLLYVLGVMIFFTINFFLFKFMIPTLPNPPENQTIIYAVLIIVNAISLFVAHKLNRLVGLGYLMAIPAVFLFIAILLVEITIHPPEE
jgi:hypothetical protein